MNEQEIKESKNNKKLHITLHKSQNKGITLVALITTIIVLLILAGVTIATLAGDNGILKKAQLAKNEIEKATVLEEVTIAWNTCNANYKSAVENEKANFYTKEQMQTELKNGTIINYKQMENKIISMEYLSNTGSTYPIVIYEDGNIEIVEKIKDLTPGELAGEGTNENPYLIESVEDLVEFSKQVNSGGEIINKTVKLNSDLNIYSYASYVNYETNKYNDYFGDDLTLIEELTTGKGFIEIGSTIKNTFTGNFKGNNKIIKGLYINREDPAIGLFGYCSGNVENLKLKYSNLSNGKYIGTLIGYSTGGNINNVECNGTINTGKNTDYIGGIIGYIGLTENSIQIENCNNYVTLKSENDKTHVGGIVGSAWILSVKENRNIKIYNCHNHQPIICQSSRFIGGIAGVAQNRNACTSSINIEKCSNNATIESSNIIGGIIGKLGDEGAAEGMNTINECYNKGTIIANNAEYVGGIAGFEYWASRLIIENCYNTGKIYLKNSNSAKVGGIVGYVNGKSMQNCYNIGEILTENIEDCFIGALLGKANSGTGYYELKNNNYHKNKMIDAYGVGNWYNKYCLVDEETLKDMAETLGNSYTADINNINGGYPILKWQE